MPLSKGTRLARNPVALLGALWLLGALSWQADAAGTYSEDAVKAAFLYRFTGYVDWPPQALAAPQFTIAVLDADGVVTELQRSLQNRAVQNRPAQVRAIRSIRELNGAQMLYVGARHKDELRHMVAQVAGRPVLVVTNEDGGLEAGSTVNFLLVDQRVRFEISLDAAQSAGLKVASELLAVAIRVRGRRVYTEAGCDDAGVAADVAPCMREAAVR